MASASLPVPAAASWHPRPRGQSLQLCAGGGPPGSSGEKAGNLAQFPHLAEGSACASARGPLPAADGCCCSQSLSGEKLQLIQSGLCLEISIWENKNGDKNLCASSFTGRPSKEAPTEREGEAAGEGVLSKVDCSAYRELSPQEVWKPCYPPTGQRNWWIYLANSLGA